MGDTDADTWATKAASAVVVEAKAMTTSMVSFAEAAPRPPIRPREVMTPAEFKSMEEGRTAPLTLFYTHLAKQDADGVPVDSMLLVHSKSTQEIDEEYVRGHQPPWAFGPCWGAAPHLLRLLPSETYRPCVLLCMRLLRR